MAQAQKILLHASALEGVGSGPSSDFGDVIADGPGVLYINVSAVAGTNPTLDPVLEEKDPESDAYIDSGLTIAQITGTGINRYEIPNVFGTIYRLSWTIGGTATPTLTFSALLLVKDRG